MADYTDDIDEYYPPDVDRSQYEVDYPTHQGVGTEPTYVLPTRTELDPYTVDYATHQDVGVTTPAMGPPTESGAQPAQPVAPVPSVLDGWQDKVNSVAKTLGVLKPDGSYDWGKIMGMGAGAAAFFTTLNQAPAAPAKSTKDLLVSLPSNTPAGFSPEALARIQVPMKAGNQLTPMYAADMPSPIRPGTRGYAEGGEVDGPLSQTFDSSQFVGYVGAGEGGGQDDMIDARLSPGEYVFDAESVSMLGDGDNAAGARKLDELREAMRAHKRSAPNDEIAPRALGPLSYMNGGLNG